MSGVRGGLWFGPTVGRGNLNVLVFLGSLITERV